MHHLLLCLALLQPPPKVDAMKPLTALPAKDAWKRLPRETPPLPVWARILAGPQPKTTAGVLALDYLHRAKNPLGNESAAKVRWAVADQMKCEYAKAYAEADLERLTTPAEVESLRKGELGGTEVLVLKFARKLTEEGYRITDAEAATLLARLGAEKMTALVHTVAFANFHNRILIGIGADLDAEDGGPFPPVELKYNPQTPALEDAPKRPTWDAVLKVTPPVDYAAPAEWKEVTFEELEKALAGQKVRKPRIPLPTKERLAALPPDARRQTDTISWMAVSSGYQPEMTLAWFAAFRSFQQEGRTEGVFSSSLFWIVTRSNDCFY